MQTILQTR